MIKRRTFEIDMIGWEVMLAWGDSMAEADRLGTKFLGAEIEYSGECTGYAAHKGRKLFMWLKEGAEGPTIAHECYHAVERIRDANGFGSEACAVLMEYLFRKVCECLESMNNSTHKQL